MRIRLTFVIIFHIFGAFIAHEDDDYSAELIETSSVASIYADPVAIPAVASASLPGITTYPIDDVQSAYNGNPCNPTCNYGTQNCAVNCAPICPTYCIQVPQLCHINCQPPTIQRPPQTITMQVPITVTKSVPEKVTRTVSKQTKIKKVPIGSHKKTQCPANHKMIEDENDNKKCVENPVTIVCQSGYELKNDRCIKTITTCANEHIKTSNDCKVRITCPSNYYQRGDECIAPEPHCSFGYSWNGKYCAPDRLTCLSGYVLGKDDRCRNEMKQCPLNQREYGGQCIRDEPRCPYGYTMVTATKVCEQRYENCPEGSYEQYGECIITEYECPAGSTESVGVCTIEEIQNKIVYEIKYVNRTMTIPGSVTTGCNSGNYGCVSPCSYPCTA